MKELQKMLNMTKRALVPEPLASQIARADFLQSQAALLKTFQPVNPLASQVAGLQSFQQVDSITKWQETLASRQLKALRPFTGITGGFGMLAASSPSAALTSSFEILRIGRTREDLVTGIARFVKALEGLNTGMLASFASANLRFPPIEIPALEVYRLAKQGWLLDPLLMVAEDDVLPFLESKPSERSKQDVAVQIQHISTRHEAALLTLVREHLEFLLDGDPVALESHFTAFRVALRSICGGEGSELATQAMFARTESLFTRAFRLRGSSKSQIKNMLYSTDEKRAEARTKLLEGALQRAYERREAELEQQADEEVFVPYWRQIDFGQERLGVACEALSQVKTDDDDEILAFDLEKARNHAQHDGVGTEALDWAVRLVLWFAGVAVVLGSILEPVPQERVI